MQDNWFSYAAKAHADFMALAKQVAMDQDSNDFEMYSTKEEDNTFDPEVFSEGEPGEADEAESDLAMEVMGPDSNGDWSDVGSDPWAWAPHFCDLSEEDLDSMSGGRELGLPERVYINFSPRGPIDKLLNSSSGLYRE